MPFLFQGVSIPVPRDIGQALHTFFTEWIESDDNFGEVLGDHGLFQID